MLRRLTLALFVLLVSGQAFATTTLPPVEVTGMRIGWTTLCTGSACSDYFDAPQMAEWEGQFMEIGDISSMDDERPECNVDGETRQSMAWSAYKAALIALFGGNAMAAMKYDHENNIGKDLTITFASGSTGVYRRADSEFRSSDGVIEIESPDCD